MVVIFWIITVGVLPLKQAAVDAHVMPCVSREKTIALEAIRHLYSVAVWAKESGCTGRTLPYAQRVGQSRETRDRDKEQHRDRKDLHVAGRDREGGEI